MEGCDVLFDIEKFVFLFLYIQSMFPHEDALTHSPRSVPPSELT